MRKSLLLMMVSIRAGMRPMLALGSLALAVASAQLMVAGSTRPNPYDCGPFLLSPGSDQMTVVVDHSTPVAATLTYRKAAGGRTVTVVHRDPLRHHIFRLTGLAPDTGYEYAVHSDGLESGERLFRTLKLAPEHYRLIVMGDVRTQPKIWGRVSRQILENEPDAQFIIGTGDYPSNGAKYQLWIDQFFVPARDMLARIPLWPAIGNHERTRNRDGVTLNEATHFFSLFELPGNGRWYRVENRFLTLLVLDSNSKLGPEGPQYAWLRGQLRSIRQRFTVVAFHHAPFTSGKHGREQADGTPVERPIDEGRRFLVPLFELYGVDLVLNGHDHLYERSEKSGVTYVVTGGGGAPLYPINAVENPWQKAAMSVHHYVTLDIDADQIDLRAVKLGGETFDSHVIRVRKAALKRQSALLTELMDKNATDGVPDIAGRAFPLELTNPCDAPLRWRAGLSETDSGESCAESVLVLEPNMKVVVDLDGLSCVSGLSAPAWRPAVYADLKIRAKGSYRGIPFDVPLTRRVTLRKPSYPVGWIDLPDSGTLPDLASVESILLDEKSAFVQNPGAYHGNGDLNGRLRFARDEHHLFLAADIGDDSVSRKGNAWDQSDSVTVSFKSVSGTSQPWTRLSFRADGTLETGVAGMEKSVSHTVARTDQGYRIRAAIPMRLLDVQDGANPFLTASVTVTDRDDAEGEKTTRHRLWSHTATGTSPSGTLRLLPR